MEFMFNREISGRVAKLEIATYDAEFSAILTDRMAEKQTARKHRAGKAYRHRKPENLSPRKYSDKWDASREKVNGGNDIWRNIARDAILRNDWESEQESMAEDTLMAEVMAEAERMERMAQEYARLNRWLMYA